MFTIIFPVLNERLRLESGVTRTVEYLHKIAFEDYEIIIVDNGSEDETPQIAEALCQKYDKVRYERINVRGGCGAGKTAYGRKYDGLHDEGR